jgi:hypothetical protein
MYCTAFNITLSELYSLVANMKEDDLELWSQLITGDLTFGDKKQLLKFRNKHLNYYYEQQSI